MTPSPGTLILRSGALRPADRRTLGAAPPRPYPYLDVVATGHGAALRIDPGAGTDVAVNLDPVQALDLLDALRVALDLSLGELVDQLVLFAMQELDDAPTLFRPVVDVPTNGRT